MLICHKGDAACRIKAPKSVTHRREKHRNFEKKKEFTRKMQLRFNDKLVEAQTTDDVLQMVSTKL